LLGGAEAYKIASALNHYSYVITGGYLCISDIQGTETKFTDICMHTKDGKSNFADLGIDGIQSCGLLHECNDYCINLNIIDKQENNTYKSLVSNNEIRIFLDTFGIPRIDGYIPYHNFLATVTNMKIKNYKGSDTITSTNYKFNI